MIDASEPTCSYPVGILKCGDKSVKVNFLHYSSFSDAKIKWDERKQRVNYSNIAIVWLVPEGLSESDIHRFDALPYARKLLISCENITNSKNVVVNRVFKEKNYHPGKILQYPSTLSIKRYLDEIDYVGFLNSES